jgi:hypothetical protein
MNYLLRGIGVVATVGVISVLAFSLPSGEARGDGDGGNVLPRLTNKNWQQECASCHIAYAPAFLPKASWQRLMGTLDNHFGENASLDPATQADILKYLVANAADTRTSRVMQSMGADAVPLRITETRWFVRKHDEVSRATWARKSIGSAANCAACHRQAEQGVFDEDTVRIPK